jgi:hypothetical protein
MRTVIHLGGPRMHTEIETTQIPVCILRYDKFRYASVIHLGPRMHTVGTEILESPLRIL